jgi:small acid-soluble spore protein F (minor alpha/beta-type SASP)
VAQLKPNLLPQSVRNHFKYEIAEELGLEEEVAEKGWGDMKSRDLGRIGGRIGGNMVKVMIRAAEEALTNQTSPDG